MLTALHRLPYRKTLRPLIPCGGRHHSNLSNSFVKFVSHPSGATIPIPTTAISPVEPASISSWGESVLNHFFEGGTKRNDEANLSQLHYRERRPQLLSSCFGWWVAINPENYFLVARTEEIVRKFAATCFRGQEYFAECVGCEYLESVIMDGSGVDEDDFLGENQNWETAIDPDRFSTIKWRQFLVRGEYSFDGKEYQSFVMKHDTGASMVGVPEEILSQPPLGVDLSSFRDKKVSYVGPGGVVKDARTYHSQYVRVNGLVTKTRVIESKRWLLGYPVLSRYVNTIDTKAKEPVSLVIQKGERDHT